MLLIYLLLHFAVLFPKKSIANINGESGIYYGAGVGYMIPTSNLKTIGNANNIGFTLGVYDEQMMIGLTFDIFGNSLMKHRNTYQIWHNDSLYLENNYFGANITLTYGYNMFQIGNMKVYATVALGYTGITYKSIEPNHDIEKGSLLISPGIHLQYPITAKSHLRLAIEYQIANRRLKDPLNTDFTGNFFHVKLMYVGCLF